MACVNPLEAYRVIGGGVAFGSSGSGAANRLQLPCGQCVECRIERSRQWAIRIVHESQMHTKLFGGEAVPNNCFVTLTYDMENIPEDGSVRVSDWQKFAKRLRKRCGPFRYFHCGEYGEENFRPHYHACIFGQDFAGDRVFFSERGGCRLDTSVVLSETWGLGFCTVGDVSYESAAYVARYIMKKAVGPSSRYGDFSKYSRYDSRTGEVWDVKPEYVTMSRRPGIGSTWFDAFMDDVYPSDECVLDGRRFRPPRFYDSKLPEDELEGLKVKRRRSVGLRKEDLTPERLRVRELYAVARLSQGKRDL